MVSALLGSDPRDRVGQRLPGWPVTGITLAQGADALLLLGQVDQVEVKRERPGDLLGAGVRPGPDQGDDLGVGPLPGPRADHRAPQELNVA